MCARKWWVPALAAFVLFAASAAAMEGAYVGSTACGDCHQTEFDNYTAFSKKAHSGDSIKVMASDLAPGEVEVCFSCHTTGHGQPGGFVSFEKTPLMGNAGCEVCHGPGSEHVESGGDPSLIKADLSIEDCTQCHNEERVGAFNFKPMLFGGAH
jgi:mono/diheme cytochrome c family protein